MKTVNHTECSFSGLCFNNGLYPCNVNKVLIINQAFFQLSHVGRSPDRMPGPLHQTQRDGALTKSPRTVKENQVASPEAGQHCNIFLHPPLNLSHQIEGDHFRFWVADFVYSEFNPIRMDSIPDITYSTVSKPCTSGVNNKRQVGKGTVNHLLCPFSCRPSAP